MIIAHHHTLAWSALCLEILLPLFLAALAALLCSRSCRARCCCLLLCLGFTLGFLRPAWMPRAQLCHLFIKDFPCKSTEQYYYLDPSCSCCLSQLCPKPLLEYSRLWSQDGSRLHKLSRVTLSGSRSDRRASCTQRAWRCYGATWCMQLTIWYGWVGGPPIIVKQSDPGPAILEEVPAVCLGLRCRTPTSSPGVINTQAGHGQVAVKAICIHAIA